MNDLLKKGFSPVRSTQILPDPFPVAGMNNDQWAAMLLDQMDREVHLKREDEVAYLSRALTIACLHSERPSKRLRVELCGLVDDLCDLLERFSSRWDLLTKTKVFGARKFAEVARRYKGD